MDQLKKLLSGLMVLVGANILGCAVQASEGEEFENELSAQASQALDSRTEFQQEIDAYLKEFGRSGTACKAGRCASVSARAPAAIRVGDDHQVGTDFYLCAEQKDGSLSSCTPPSTKYDCIPEGLCSCQMLFDCLDMFDAGACKGGTTHCTWVNGEPYCTCAAA